MNTTRLTPRVLVAAAAISGLGAVAVGLDVTGDASSTAEAQAEATASIFVPIDSYRAVDTRMGPDPGRLEVSETLTVTADEDFEGNQVIPDEATAVTFNITAVNTRGTGFFQVTTARRELGNTSTVNWTSDGANVANSGVTAVFESQEINEPLENTFAVFIDGVPSASAHLVVDITGYYVPA